jgi:hypothetical protein
VVAETDDRPIAAVPPVLALPPPVVVAVGGP